MSNDFFKACAFADDEGNTSWNNYGGVFYDDGKEYDWIEDDYGLTQEQAEKLSKILNDAFRQHYFLCLSLHMPIIRYIVKNFINTLKKEEGV